MLGCGGSIVEEKRVRSRIVSIPLAGLSRLGKRGLSGECVFEVGREDVVAVASRELDQLERPSKSQVVWQRAKTKGKPDHET